MPDRLRVLLLAAVLVLSGCGGEARATDPDLADDGMYGAVLDQPYTVPGTALEDTTGRTEALDARLSKPLTLVFFGYTNCPDICVATMADLASTVNRLDEQDASKVEVLFVTTDPARDDAATLRTYLDRFDEEFEGLTGPLPRIVRAADALHLAVEKGRRLPTGGYEVTHSTPVLGATEDGRVRLVWSEGTSAAKLAHDVHRALSRPDALEPS